VTPTLLTAISKTSKHTHTYTQRTRTGEAGSAGQWQWQLQRPWRICCSAPLERRPSSRLRPFCVPFSTLPVNSRLCSCAPVSILLRCPVSPRAASPPNPRLLYPPRSLLTRYVPLSTSLLLSSLLFTHSLISTICWPIRAGAGAGAGVAEFGAMGRALGWDDDRRGNAVLALQVHGHHTRSLLAI
jgi:hypothetical protein